MTDPARKLTTVDEFLRFEGEMDRRYQLFGGQIVMMAPPGRVHGLLTSRLSFALRSGLQRPCEPQDEAGILLPWTSHSYYVADVAVTCAPPGPEQWCPDPVLIVEVLSPSTESDDRGVKLGAYRRLASVQDILLVASDQPAVEQLARAGESWTLTDIGPGGVIRLASFRIELSVDEHYADLGLEPGETDTATA